MTEEQLGKAMKAHALSEGKTPRLPPRIVEPDQYRNRSHKMETTVAAVMSEYEKGKRVMEIARAVGVGKRYVSRIIKEESAKK